MQTSAELITPLPDDVPRTIHTVKRQLRGRPGDLRAAYEVAAGDHRGGRRGRRRTHRRRLRRAGRRVRRRRGGDRPGGAHRGDPPAWLRRRARHVRARPGRGLGRRTGALPRPQRLHGPLPRTGRRAVSALASSRPQIYGVYWSRLTDRGPPTPADGHRSPLPQLVLGPRVRRASVVRPRPRHRLPRPHPATPAEHPLARTVPARRPGRSSDGCSPPTSVPTATSSPATGTATTRGTAPTATRSTSSRPR